MTAVYDEVEIEDMDFDPQTVSFYYPCPCGDRFQEELQDGEEIARCPSCSLMIRVVYDNDALRKSADLLTSSQLLTV